MRIETRTMANSPALPRGLQPSFEKVVGQDECHEDKDREDQRCANLEDHKGLTPRQRNDVDRYGQSQSDEHGDQERRVADEDPVDDPRDEPDDEGDG
jgi:hypothetical protein